MPSFHQGDSAPSSTNDDDDHSACSSSYSHGSTSGGESRVAAKVESDNKDDTLASGEKSVRRSKMLVYTALLLTAAIGTLIYFLMSNEEMSTCQQNFHAYAKEVAEIGDTKVVSIFSHVNALAISITSYALNNNMSHPNVTLPNFDARTKGVVETSAIPMIIYAPIVRDSDRAGWEAYTMDHDWIGQDMKYNTDKNVHPGSIPTKVFPYSDNLFRAKEGLIPSPEEAHTVPNNAQKGSGVIDDGVLEGMSFPLWQLGPMPWNASIIKMDLLTNPPFRDTIRTSTIMKRNFLSGVMDLDFLHYSQGWNAGVSPRSTAVVPVREDFYEDSKVVGFVFGKIKWVALFERILPKGTKGIGAVVSDPCSTDFAILIEGEEVVFLGYGPAENFTEFANSRLRTSYELADYFRDNDNVTGTNRTTHSGNCDITLTLYSTKSFEESCSTNKPALYTTAVVLVFTVTIVMFALYDFWVNRRQQRLLAQAKRTDAIVSSLFPRHVQQRMMEAAGAPDEVNSNLNWKGRLALKQQTQGMLQNEERGIASAGQHGSRPIADLYAESTIMFADIVGFTQWASCRVPSDVFTLLESIFAAFDKIAHHRRVYKVETVGDCYVAACGVPEPRKDHALVMARFARDCVMAFNAVVKHLEADLGPDTGDLGIRVGVHSGPVTAGVLRGERSRFQLFGDTMNTCSRIESTGHRNKIHMSRETAEILMAHGKAHWCRKREESVTAKGKGVLSTFWLEVKGDSTQSTDSSSQGTADHPPADFDERRFLGDADRSAPVDNRAEKCAKQMPDHVARLAKWNADLLARKLSMIAFQRMAAHKNKKAAPKAVMARLEREIMERVQTPLEEVQDAIRLPMSSDDGAAVAMAEGGASSPVDLGPAVEEQLHSYVMTIALLYRDNPFHCFEHATHVTMSVVKLLSRVDEAGLRRSSLSDPLTQFAVVFSALVHDVDHRGVPNRQLAREGDPAAAAYHNRSAAEQNSVDVAWSLLMGDDYRDLRAAIYSSPEELKRFRQLVVNAVMATDIMDRDLSLQRKERWSRAFSESPGSSSSDDDEDATTSANRRATIVLEHLIQASDVAHTMQHWNIYRKWNARLFEESCRAFREGRAEADPAEGWYEGELGFFDHYVLPLAQKLKDCGAFGVSSDEYLNYAQQNRREWESRGRELVEEMAQKASASAASAVSASAAVPTAKLSNENPHQRIAI